MLKKIKLKIGHYILRKAIIKHNHSPQLITLSQAKKVAFLFDAQSSQSVAEVKSFLKYFLKLNIDVDVLGFIDGVKNKKEYISTLHINYFNMNDVNFFGVPNSRKIDTFINKKYDFLINLSLENSFCTKYLALLSQSKYRIGVFSKERFFDYDLMFNLKVKSLGYFIEYLIHYLELINTNNNEK